MLLLSFHGGDLFHPVQVALQGIEVLGPESPERNEPCIELHEWLWSQSIESPLRFNSRFHEPGFSQHSQVLRHGGLRQAELAFYLTHRPLRREQQAQMARRLGSATIANDDSRTGTRNDTSATAMPRLFRGAIPQDFAFFAGLDLPDLLRATA